MNTGKTRGYVLTFRCINCEPEDRIRGRILSTRKTSGRLILGRPFRAVAGPRPHVSPRVLRHKVSLQK